MGGGFTSDDLKRLGLERQKDGSYAKSQENYNKSIKRIKDSSEDLSLKTAEELPLKHNKEPLQSTLTILGIVAGLNSSNGLIRSHWSTRKKQKNLYRQIIRDQVAEGNVRVHTGKVKVTYIGYKSVFMDWDNFGSSFKNLGDSLVAEKILIDDSPKIITEFIPKQEKCKRRDQKVVVIIEDV